MALIGIIRKKSALSALRVEAQLNVIELYKCKAGHGDEDYQTQGCRRSAT